MSSSSRPLYRYLVFILSICLGMNLISMPIVGAAPGKAGRIPKKHDVVAEIGEIPNKLPKTKLELTSKRTKYSTRYLNPDGSFSEEIYLAPQFYQDPVDKKFKKIDNNIKASTEKPGKHQNTANEFTTWFADTTGTGDLVIVEKYGKSLALVPTQVNRVKGLIKGNDITYAGIFPDADVRYQVQGSGVKEDIVIHKKPSNPTFSFELKLQGLKAVTEKDGTIVFHDQKGKKLWYFEKPYMTDAAGTFSDKVKQTLREEIGKTYVDVVADPSFLRSAQYPVTIDPTINQWDVLRDTFVSSAFPTSSYSSNTSMYTGQDSGYFGTTRTLMQFYLPSLPSESKISSVNVNVYQTRNETTSVSVDLFRTTSSWTGSVTWSTQPTIKATKESTVTNNTVNSYWQWDITQLAKDWYNAVEPNYGLMLKQQNETTSPFRAFNSVNSGSNTPRLTINYTVDPIGLEDYWGYSTNGVNVANGNLVVQESDISIPGRGVPVSVSRTYNSRKSMISGIFGYGWFSNVETNLVDAGTGPITLIDADNTRHIFGQQVGGGYVAHSGVYLTLVKNSDNTYTITQMDGTKTNFNSSGKVSSIVDTNGNITSYTYDTGGKLTSIQDASGRTTTFAYGTNGYVSSVTDPANRTILYGYDGAGNLTTVTDPENKVTTFGYDATHNLTSHKDARNITTTIVYDASDRIISISSPITIDGTQQTSTVNYSYDTTNSVTTVTDGEGHRVDYTYNPNLNVVQITKNPLDAVNKAITTFDYSNDNNLTQVKDANANNEGTAGTYVYTYDGKGNITGVKLPENQQAYNTFDSENNLIEGQDFNNNLTNFDYDPKNNQTESIDPMFQSQANRYFSNGNLQYSTHAMSAADNLITNSSFELDQDTNNWPDSWTTHTAATWSSTTKFGKKSVSISNPTAEVTVKSNNMFAAAGNKYIVSGYVKTTSTTNTAFIQVEFFDSANNSLGKQKAYEVKGTHDWTRIQAVVDAPANTDNMQVSIGLNSGSGTVYFDGVQVEKGTVLSAYNLVDNSSFERGNANLPINWTTSGNFTANDKLVQDALVGAYSLQITGQSGVNKFIKQKINISGDASTPLTLSGWSKQVGADPNGGYYHLQVAINHTDGTTDWSNANYFSKTASDWQHVAAQVKPTKAFDSIEVYYYYYNQTGTAWFDAIRLGVGATHTFKTYDTGGNYITEVDNPVANNVKFGYDAVGNRTSVTDGKGRRTLFVYDKRNLLTSVTDANLKTTSYGYDSVGNRTSITDAKNNVSTYEYNELNKISKITNPLNQVSQIGYDKNGNIKKLIFPKGDAVSYTYNTLNRLDGVYHNGVKQWGVTYDDNGNITAVADNTGKTTTYVYDKNNRTTQLAEGQSNKMDYEYDDNGNPLSLKMTTGTSPAVTISYRYNSLNQLESLSRNTASQAKFVYDERGNTISTTKGNGTYSTFEYNDANRLKSMKNYNSTGELLDTYSYSYDANGNRSSVITSSGTISYQYDVLNQLTQETLADGTTITYEYDAVGNRTKKIVTQSGNSTTTNYTYDAANQLTAVNGQVYTYDANGNLTDNGAKTFVYDMENRLTQVKDSAGTSLASFTYDIQGKRTSMTTVNGTIYFHYSGDKVIYETDASNNIVAEYTWDSKGNPVTMTRGNSTYYYHMNGHGDITSLTDANGNVVAQYQYDAWGNIINSSGSMKDTNPYRYAGYRYDKETGLYYLMARYYDASLGRFITRDTFYGYENMPLTLHLYQYCGNNPVNLSDPTGHDWFGWVILDHWLAGSGTELNFSNDPKWSAYMKANRLLRAKVTNILFGIREQMPAGTTEGVKKYINTSVSMSIQNGELINGYQFLHGTNAKVGNFRIVGTITKYLYGNTRFFFWYQWNDIIDPNPKYLTDIVKSYFGKVISFGQAKEYVIRIGWTDDSRYRPTGYGGRSTGWLFQ